MTYSSSVFAVLLLEVCMEKAAKIFNEHQSDRFGVRIDEKFNNCNVTSDDGLMRFLMISL